MLEKVGPFKAGDKVKASWLQQMLTALKIVSNIRATPPLRVAMVPGGVLLSMGDIEAGESVYDAKVIDNASINGMIRYQYWIEFGHWSMEANIANGGVWVTDDDNAGDGYVAFNSPEDMNVGTGSGLTGTLTIGVGVTAKQSTGAINGGSCIFKPIPIGGYCQVKDRGTNPNSSGNFYYTIVNFANSAQ